MKKFVLPATIATLAVLAIAPPVKADSASINAHVLGSMVGASDVTAAEYLKAIDIIEREPSFPSSYAKSYCRMRRNGQSASDAASKISTAIEYLGKSGVMPIREAIAHMQIARFSLHYAIDQDCRGF